MVPMRIIVLCWGCVGVGNLYLVCRMATAMVVNSYKQMGLDPKAVGEATYRLAVDPKPPLRSIVATDDQFFSLLPLWCR